jgi:hypothetical protein
MWRRQDTGWHYCRLHNQEILFGFVHLVVSGRLTCRTSLPPPHDDALQSVRDAVETTVHALVERD